MSECRECAHLRGLLGDRDVQIRELTSARTVEQRAVADLAEVRKVLDELGAPVLAGPHATYTLAGRIRKLAERGSVQ